MEWAPDLRTAFTTLQGSIPVDPSGTNIWTWDAKTSKAGFLRLQVQKVGGL
ncbi:MAG: hypothetical protein AAB466_12880 [Verrucomicrobiota bacterium]